MVKSNHLQPKRNTSEDKNYLEREDKHLNILGKVLDRILKRPKKKQEKKNKFITREEYQKLSTKEQEEFNREQDEQADRLVGELVDNLNEQM